MNNLEKFGYGITGIIGLITGGSALGLSKIDKLYGKKKIFQVIGVILTGIGMIFTALFADANLYPEKDEEEEEILLESVKEED